MKTVSVDAGNGGMNAVMMDDDGVLAHSYMPSTWVTYNSGGANFVGINRLKHTVWRFEGDEYVIGKDVVLSSDTGGERFQGEVRYGSEFHACLVAAGMADLGVPNGEVRLVLFAPPGIYSKVKPAIEKRFIGGLEIEKGSSTNGGWQKHCWDVKKVTVYPEAVSAVDAIVRDNLGNIVAPHLVRGNVLIIDIGFNTVDRIRLVNGAVDTAPSFQMTLKGQGLYTRVIVPITNHLRRDFPDITESHVDIAVYADDMSLVYGGQQFSIQELHEHHMARYADYLVGVMSQDFISLDGYAAAYLVGGGANKIMWDKMNAAFPGRFVPLSHYPPEIPGPTFLNAVGGLYKAMKKK